MYISLYRKYRPQTFSDMVGQSAAVSVLQESLKEGRLGHAYLFSGPRGCGKTSAARLVAKSLNCQNPLPDHEPCGKCSACIGIALGEHLDVIEIDGASNRGIGEIRDLKTHVNLKPLSAQYKVYIIDEVHMLTDQAFNALLKTLEEPPSNVVFLLATTEPHKVPVTIRSRCQHIPFHRISVADMIARITYVCDCENIPYDREAVWEIARQADGALRDSLSLTEQAIALGKGSLTLDSVRDLTGGSNRTELEKWTVNMHSDPAKAAVDLSKMLASGMSPERFCESLFAIFRDLWIYSLWGEKGLEALELSDSGREFLKNEAAQWNAEQLRSVCIFCNELLPRTRYGMRIDVFSGLIMLEITNIISGYGTDRTVRQKPAPQPAAHEPRNNIAMPIHTEAPRTPEPTKVFASANTVSEQNAAKTDNKFVFDAVKAAMPPLSSIKFDSDAMCAEMGESDFSKLINSLESKKLLIASALLHADLVRTETGWDLSAPGESLAELILSMPQNRQILSSAVYEVWNIQDEHSVKAAQQTQETFKEIVVPQTKEENATVEAADVKPTDRVSSPIADDIGHVLKRMGADILYVHDANFNGDEEESCERHG